MLETNDWMLFFFFIASVQGVILSSVIFIINPNKLPHKFLGVLFFIISLGLLHTFLEHSIHAFNVNFPVPLNYGFAIGPLALLHIRSILVSKYRLKLLELLHFLPSLIFDVLFFITFFITLRLNIGWAYDHIQIIQLIYLGIGATNFIQLVIYVYLSRKEIRKDYFRPKETQQSIRDWFRLFGFFGIAVFLFYGFTIILALFHLEKIDNGLKVVYPLNLLFVVAMYWMGYVYLIRFRNLVGKFVDRKNYLKFDTLTLQGYKDSLLEILREKKLHCNEKLSVKDLAKEIDLSTKELSFIIAESFHSNFNDLINGLRVREFVEKIKDPASNKFSIEGLSREVGFSSKASFYRAFKKEHGQTPSEYITSKSIK